MLLSAMYVAKFHIAGVKGVNIGQNRQRLFVLIKGIAPCSYKLIRGDQNWKLGWESFQIYFPGNSNASKFPKFTLILAQMKLVTLGIKRLERIVMITLSCFRFLITFI